MSGLFGVRFSGPLAVYAHGFAEELARQGYKVTGAKGQLFLAAHLSRWLAERDLKLRALTAPEVVGEYFSDDGQRATPTTARSRRWYRCWSTCGPAGCWRLRRWRSSPRHRRC
jgi:hypothetical protein